MSRLTSGSRLSRPAPVAHTVDREPDPMSWPSAILWGIVTGLALCFGAWLGLPALIVLSDALRGWAGLR